MALITLSDAQLAFGHVPLLDHTDFALESNERVGLIGRNGAGKSSLLKILGGLERVDDGTLQLQQGLRIAYVAQEPVLDFAQSIFESVSAGLAGLLALIDQYTRGEGDLDAMQGRIEADDGWNWEQRVQETLHRLHLDPQARVGTLSGGVRKRVALAQALVTRPDVLLLDEPTNHLDLDAIEWLEGLLVDFRGSIVTITHDRTFLDRVATRIVELDRGQLRSYPGNFTRYQALKEEQLAQEAVVNAKADKLLAQEEVWIRKGVEARRTRAQGRITRLQQLREQRAGRRDALGRVQMDLASGAPSGKIVAELAHVHKAFGDRVVVRDFSATILRGDKVGLMGPNGAGKTTLLKLILGELAADSGKVRQGANLQVAYFDQMRDQLDLDATLEDFISPGSEWIEIGRQRKHVKSYLGDFLFSPARAGSPVRSLSGGERNRLLLARLFARPANVLVLDEPTNDLDIDTLELLEDLLQNYEGTVFLVSHDRAFLDNVVTSTIAHEGDGRWREYEGGVQDWLTQSQRARALALAAGRTAKHDPVGGSAAVPSAAAPATPASTTAPAAPAAAATPRRKLSYKEQRELEALPARIQALEQEQSALQAELADGTLYARDGERAAQLAARNAQIEDDLMAALERWEALGSL
ncbi:MAG TPA: ATP-binding cassette domain-containing protein [Ramlibacter sp.]|jgi:ATP-binding cassette subfamily F protein uup|uniref:ATP-binding cassette domain-containing protein n=1 Tax=Ramlibacter sp. TaxID=1917967 RepID=UPI002D36E58A|nr:ATP-binding cassette domain-containing protein [Ramlibacter sp.]HZY16985.1 ATP-binding cassette domain-containing protein [Ramlibacter sp.]